MLYTDVNEFGWSVDNYGTTFTNTGFGTSHTTGVANTKGTATSLIAGASVTEDCYGITILFSGGGTSTARREFLVDLLIDEAGGTSWSTKINNLLVSAPALGIGGYAYFFPIYFKNGTSIGIQAQCNAATQTIRCGVKLVGKPSHPHLLKVGCKVETLGADTTNTTGVALTSGASNVKGDWISLGTTGQDNWYWQMGCSVADATMQVGAKFFDLSAGDATNKVMCLENTALSSSDFEQMDRNNWAGDYYPVKRVPSGQTVYGRVAETVADTPIQATAYGVN